MISHAFNRLPLSLVLDRQAGRQEVRPDSDNNHEKTAQHPLCLKRKVEESRKNVHSVEEKKEVKERKKERKKERIPDREKPPGSLSCKWVGAFATWIE